MDLEKLVETFEEESSDSDIITNPVSDEKIVFVTPCFHRSMGQLFNLPDNENAIFTALLQKTKVPKGSWQIVPAIKLANLEEDDISTKMYHRMRPILHDEMELIQPKLIIPMGNVAMKTLTKKSGIKSKRGKEYALGGFPVAPTYGLDTLFLEPKFRSLFIQDVNNAYDKFIQHKNKLSDSPYTLCTTVKEAVKHLQEAGTNDVIAVDLETTGLDFNKDIITTFGVAYGEDKAFVIPVYHKESPFTEKDISVIRKEIAALMSNKNVAKVFHNCKFDLKFLRSFGIKEFNDIDDTQIMHSLVDENLPHGLMDLVKQWYPHDLERF
jgi:hypothetical protein